MRTAQHLASTSRLGSIAFQMPRAEPLDVTPLPAPIETPKPLPEGVFRPPRRR
jgi:hypothetical protein